MNWQYSSANFDAFISKVIVSFLLYWLLSYSEFSHFRTQAFTAVKRKKQENYFKDKVFIFTVQSLILNKYSPGLLNFLELY